MVLKFARRAINHWSLYDFRNGGPAHLSGSMVDLYKYWHLEAAALKLCLHIGLMVFVDSVYALRHATT
eukprot:5167764-Amphidinium_carterae.1